MGCSDSELAASRTYGELILQGELETRQGPNFPYGECAFGVEQYTALAF